MGTLNFTRAALSHVGPLMPQVIGPGEALSTGLQHMHERTGSSGAASYAVMTMIGALIPAGVIYGAVLLMRRLVI